MRLIVRAVEGLSRACGYTSALLVLALIALMNYEVLARYLFGAPTIWSYEVSTMVMGASFILAISYAIHTDSHVRVDLLKQHFGARGQTLIDLAGNALFLLPILAWLCWGLWDYWYAAYLSGEASGQSAWNPKLWPFRLVLFAGALAWTLQVGAEILKGILSLRTPNA